ncbi:sucrose transport protein [Cordyceps fumosorosea ARSEF 2679]|uniref:Sucrose transport protein n=1 Tax=Cordyceps fumosorosea (strain ARSEF 2679) TaxID=1081104 RepID=A0A162N0C6_CORFA|nr:sucrose transport protein [Cordyceps fumosorosea ARSEF 2679]OAA73489.1 sucrose transport protein [Cordyceps fumosorosea ARSEF 2679]
MAAFAGESSIRGSSEAMRMVLLTFCTIGITFTWGVEMTYCTPYLLSLGLSKSNTSMVWIAGPLSGLIVQPVIGVLSDENTSRWGRRRPMMVLGAVIVAAAMLVLGFTKELVGLFVEDTDAARMPTVLLAVLAIYVVDFAINAVMSCSRSLIVDTLPIEKQQSGAAWASRMSAIGNVIGYAGGAVDLVSILGTTFGDTQFKLLTLIAVAAILGTTAVTCWAVTEKVLLPDAAHQKNRTRHPSSSSSEGRFRVVAQILATIRHLPPRVRAICWAQFWSWVGWFPFLFYSTTWVGETYFRYDAPASAGKDALGDIGRIGSRAFVLSSLITLTASLVLPLVVRSPDEPTYTQRPHPVLTAALRVCGRWWSRPDLLTTWVAGHALFAAAMTFAPFATSYRFATALVCLCAVPWAIAGWAPSALLGVEVNKLAGQGSGYHPLTRQDVEMTVLGEGSSSSGSPSQDAGGSSAELSGIYFGILNVYTTLPQFVGTFISMIVFALLEPGKSRELGGEDGDKTPSATPTGPNAISVCLFIGAMSTIVSAFVTRRLRTLE